MSLKISAGQGSGKSGTLAATMASFMTLLLVAGCGTSATTTAASVARSSTSAAVRPATTRASARTAADPPGRARTPSRRLERAMFKPPIVWDPIPFGAKRKAEMAAYAARHYGLHTYKLIDPRVIVIHYTDGPDFQSAYNTFAADVPDVELHELPGTCAHFVIDRAGVVHQLVPLNLMCRHTVGLNWTAIGIEHVGFSDQQILRNPRELRASLRLVHWLRCRFHITVKNVIGHNESLSSPYHHEQVPSLRTQTHGDWVHADMNVYRALLGRLGGCPGT